MPTRKLLEEPVVAVYPSLVRDLGANRAIVLQQIYWLAAQRGAREHDGHLWAPITYPELGAETGLGDQQARRAIMALESDGILVSCQPEHFQRRKWYRVNTDHELFTDTPPSVAGDTSQPRASDASEPRASDASSLQSEELETAELELGLGDPDRAATVAARTTAGRALRETRRAPRARTPRDDIFDALVQAFGKASTPSRASMYGKACTELLTAGATPEQIIRARVVMSRRGWDDPTPLAMAKHWDSLIATPTENPAASRWWENENGATSSDA